MRTFTIYMAPISSKGYDGKHGNSRQLWYALCDGSGAPPLYFGLGPNQEPNNIDPNIDRPLVTRTLSITKKEFRIIKRLGEEMYS